MSWKQYEDWEEPLVPWWRNLIDYFSPARIRRLPRSRLYNGYEQVFDYELMRWKYVHGLVARAKLGGPIPLDHEVHHVNGDKRDNRPDNLAVLPVEVHRAIHDVAAAAAAEGKSYTAALVETYKEFISRGTIDGVQMGDAPQEGEQGGAEGPDIAVVEAAATDRPAAPTTVPSARSQLSRQETSDSLAQLLRSMRRRSLGRSATCPKCGGRGYLPEYRHVSGGICFRCYGTGRSTFG